MTLKGLHLFTLMRILLFHFDADLNPDPASQNNADPDPQHWREAWLSREMSGNVETSYSSLASIAVLAALQIRIQPSLTTFKKRRMQKE
jgi:hypothetical protein